MGKRKINWPLVGLGVLIMLAPFDDVILTPMGSMGLSALFILKGLGVI